MELKQKVANLRFTSIAMWFSPNDMSELPKSFLDKRRGCLLKKTDITRLIEKWSEGDREAHDLLIYHVYDDLRAMARRIMTRERANHTWEPTDLVNEFWHDHLRKPAMWRNRNHFFNSASLIMRHLLNDYHKHKTSRKVSGQLAVQWSHIEFARLPDPETVNTNKKMCPIEYLHCWSQLAEDLERKDPRASMIFDRRIMGLTQKEIAKDLKICEKTVRRDLQHLGAWLGRELGSNKRPRIEKTDK